MRTGTVTRIRRPGPRRCRPACICRGRLTPPECDRRLDLLWDAIRQEPAGS